MWAFTKEVFHCFHFSTLLAVGIRSHHGFECFVVCPCCSVENLKWGFSGFGSEGWKTKKLVCIIECLLRGLYTYVISYSWLVSWSISISELNATPCYLILTLFLRWFSSLYTLQAAAWSVYPRTDQEPQIYILVYNSDLKKCPRLPCLFLPSKSFDTIK